MDFKEYQEKAHGTSLNTLVEGNKWLYPVLGLAGEAGEVCNKIQKLFRDKEGKLTPEFIDKMKKELGDVAWYLAETCTKLNIDLNEIVQENIDKLYSRKERGVIKGSGDNR